MWCGEDGEPFSIKFRDGSVQGLGSVRKTVYKEEFRILKADSLIRVVSKFTLPWSVAKVEAHRGRAQRTRSGSRAEVARAHQSGVNSEGTHIQKVNNRKCAFLGENGGELMLVNRSK